MCQSKANGGQRCATYLRRAWEEAPLNTPAWDAAAAEYATTHEGHDVIDKMRFNARMLGDFHLEAACRSAMIRASNIRHARRYAKDALSV